MLEKLLTAEQVADYLGIHPKTLYKKLRQNEIALTIIKLPGRNIAFRPRDVERYLEMHEVVHDGTGSGRRRDGIRKRNAPEVTTFRFMTDAEAQEFFEGVERLDDGALACSPDTDEN